MWFLAFLSSLGALLFEFSIGQFISMLIGNSAFGYTFVIGGFLFSMGIGSWLADHWPRVANNPRNSLVTIELIIPILMLLSLPLLSATVFFARQMTPILDNCQALVCSSVGVLVVGEALILLLAVGILVGMEIPLFTKVGRSNLGKILAGDYFGAFVAGIIFSAVLLPFFGLIGILNFAAALHLSVAYFLLVPGRRNKFIWIILVLFNSLMIFQSAKVEGALFHYLTWPSRAEKSEVLLYRNTGKQSVLFTQDTYSSGQVDQRLFLDGFLQWSTLGGIQSYHQGLTGIRSDLGSEPKKILILGGGEGIAANQLIAMAPQDYIQILDFDCQLLKMSSSHRELRVLAPKVWDSKNVQVKCADAFWFVSQKSQEEMWDLVLIDFPHGIGDAASSKVETLGFYSSVWNLLVPGGYISTHHENFGSDSQVCVKKNLELAGFETSDQGFQGMGFTYGKKISTSKRVIAYDASIIQSELRLPCWKIF